MWETDGEPLNIKRNSIIAVGLVAVILAISLIFFYLTNDGDFFARNASVYLEINEARIRVDVNRDLYVMEVIPFNIEGQLILYGIRYRNEDMGDVLISVVMRAAGGGFMGNIFASVPDSPYVDDEWRDRIDKELDDIFFVLEQRLADMFN